MTADPLTIAYIALGAQDALDIRVAENGGVCLSAWGGHLGFIDKCIVHAARLDELAAPHAEEFTKVFVYDVAEPFGAALAKFLLNGIEPPIDDLADDLLREACQ